MTQQTNKYELRSIDVNVNSNDKKGRIPLGTKREFHLRFLCDNWTLTNQEIGGVLGITSGSVSRLRQIVRSSPGMLEIAFGDFMKYRNSVTVPDSLKFQAAVKIISSILLLDRQDKQDKVEEKVGIEESNKILRAYFKEVPTNTTTQ